MALSPSDALHQLQQDFARALHYQPNEVTETMVPGIFPAEQLLQIYRNNFIIGLSEVLSATYPCCQAVVGEECFTQLARQHVLHQPLEQGDVSHYGAGFADTIECQPSLVAAVPYLADLARLEWQADRASQLPLAPPLDLGQLAAIREDNFGSLRLTVAPSVRTLDTATPAASLWQMIRRDNLIPLDLTQPESALILRRPDGIEVLATTPAATALVRLCQAGQPLGQASDPMLECLPGLIQQQIFTTLHGLPQGDCTC